MKELKDYLHLYLPFEVNFFGFKYTVIGFKDCGHFFHFWHEHGFFDVLKSDFKLPLRPLSDMTDEEEVERGKVILSARDEGLSEMAEVVRWQLSKHFDLFNLHEAGLAIDKKDKKDKKDND